MGIPSFYRHLCRRFPHIIQAGAGPAPEWLCLDFNCAMYYVLRKQPPVSSASSEAAWSASFCKGIADYMAELITMTRPTKGVYVSCDGVVCAAKRRQQRLRRFKGPWTSAQETLVRHTAGGAEKEGVGWDQNALTPGSAFMAQLGQVLIDAGRRLEARMGITVQVSTTAEAGEGEHKLLRVMRSVRPRSCTIYGLDADLILLSLLLQVDTGADVRLLREAQEFESRGADGEWRTLSIRGLSGGLGGLSASQIRDFVAAMSLLGNDFLPRSLTHTVRDDGIPELLATLRASVWGSGLSIVGRDGQLQRAGVVAILRAWAIAEERDMLVAAQNALAAARRPAGIADSPEETALRVWNSAPARWASLIRLLTDDERGLVPDWRTVYRESWHAGESAIYLEGMAWVWDYYSGRAVDQGWSFPEHLPPLWGDVLKAAESRSDATLAAPAILYPEPLPEWLHLLAVLPVESVRRLLPAKYHAYLTLAPWYWPKSWSFFDVGRTQMWECEPVIPMIPETVLREWAVKG